MGATKQELPEGCQTKVELMMRLLAMGWGDKYTCAEALVRIKEDYNIDLANSQWYRAKMDYNKSIGRTTKTKAVKSSQLIQPSHLQIKQTESPSSILQSFIESIEACGGVSQAKKILDLLEAGIK